MIARSASRAIITVTEARQLESNHWEISLGVERQPEYGNNVFAKKQMLFPEDNLVSIQAVKEYLALVWTQYQRASRNLGTPESLREQPEADQVKINPISAMAKVQKAIRNIFGHFRNMDKVEGGRDLSAAPSQLRARLHR